MRKIVVALVFLFSCGGVELPQDMIPDITLKDMNIAERENWWEEEEVPPEYSTEPMMQVAPPWAPKPRSPWDDLIKPSLPEPPPCIVCKDEFERMP